MTVIASTILDGTDAPSAGTVRINLVGAGFVDGAQVLRTVVIDVEAADEGAWSADLIPNDSYEVANTYYLVDQEASDGTRDERAIIVPATGGPYSLYNVLTDVPGDLDPAEVASVRTALEEHEADTGLHAGNPLQVVHDGTPLVGDWLKVKTVDPLVVERADEPSGSGHTTHAIGDVTDLQATLDAESTARADADTTLATAITDEATARATADTALDGRVDALEASSGTHVPLAIIDAAGDLIVGSAADTAARLAKGTALQVLRVNAAGTALEWADPSGGGGDHLDSDHDDAFQPLDSDLTAIAALTTTVFGRSLLELANAGAARTALELGTAAQSDAVDFDAAGSAAAAQAASQPLDSDLTAIAALTTTAYGRSLLEAANAGAARTLLGLGTAAVANTGDFDAAGAAAAAQAASQPLDADLTALAGLTSAANKLPYFTGSGTASLADLSAFIRTLLDDADAATARTTLDAAQASHGHTTLTANAQATSYTLVLADAGKVVEISNASANNLTVPPNSSVAFPTGTVVEVHQSGAGQTTVVPGSGVTVNARGGALKLAGQYATARLRKTATDSWVLVGDITT